MPSAKWGACPHLIAKMLLQGLGVNAWSAIVVLTCRLIETPRPWCFATRVSTTPASRHAPCLRPGRSCRWRPTWRPGCPVDHEPYGMDHRRLRRRQDRRPRRCYQHLLDATRAFLGGRALWCGHLDHTRRVSRPAFPRRAGRPRTSSYTVRLGAARTAGACTGSCWRCRISAALPRQAASSYGASPHDNSADKRQSFETKPITRNRKFESSSSPRPQ